MLKSFANNWITATLTAILAVPLFTSPCGSASLDQNMGMGMVDSIGGVTDVIVGHNNKGPYFLSWTNIDADNISVVINGRSLQRGSDYNIDLAKGMLSFNSVLVADAIVRVSYRTTPGKSQRSTGGVNIPVTLNLFQRQNGSMQLTGLFAQDDPRNPDKGKTVVGIGGNRKWTGSNLNTMFFISQRNDSNTTDSSSPWDRAALKFGGDTNIGALKLSGNYLKSGNSFGGAKEYNVGLGKQAMDLAAAFAPSKTVQASASFRSSEDTAGQTKGNKSTVNEQSLAYTPFNSTKLSIAHSVNDTATAAPGSEKTVDAMSVKLSQAFGTATSALATFDNSTVTLGNQADKTSTRGIQVNSSAIQRVSLRTALMQKESQSQGREQTFGFGVTAKPVDQVNLDVGYGTVDNNNVGHQSSTDVKVTANPVKQVAVQAAYSGVDSTKLGQVTKTNVSLQATPVAGLQLAGSVAGNADNTNQQFQRNFSLSGAPSQYAKFTAMFSQKGVNSLDDVTKGAELQLMPVKRTRLTAGYKYIEAGTNIMTIYDYFAETKPFDFFSLAGNYRLRDLKDGDAPDSTSMSLALSPARFFTFTGEYKANPEDNKGVVQTFNSTTLGLTTKVGSLGIETGFTQKDEYLASRLSDERKVGLALPVFGHGKLTTGCSIARLMAGGENSTRTYSLGYRHSLGSDFSLSLTGSYTQYLQNKALMPDKTEYSAEANLGVRF